MEVSFSSSSSSRRKLFRRVISPAIEGQSCPICLEDLHGRTSAVLRVCKHAYCEGCIRRWSFVGRKCSLCNSEFDSWFSRISLSSQTFRTVRLPALEEQKRSFEEDRPRRISIDSSVRRRTAALPWRRSFGRPGFVGAEVVNQRKLQWRSSIYERRLKAVPLTPFDHIEQNVLGSIGAKERVLRRIEPWVRRELEAILGDPDPMVIVHVATSLFVASCVEKRAHFPSGRPDVGDQFFAELRPFLLEKTDMFWHELRCFAASSFNMETYDAVIEYGP